jgi:hypothetical protein
LHNLAISHLSLYDGLESLSVIAQSPSFAGLITLALEGPALSDAPVVALADSPFLANLRNLSLENASLSESGLRALAQSPMLRRLRRLRIIPYPDTQDKGDLRRAIAASPCCRLVTKSASDEMKAILGGRLELE